jgi:hypothetical protein
VGAEFEPSRAEYLVALGEPGHGLAHRLDFAGELHAQYVDLLWPPKAVHESYEKWVGLSEPPVRRRNCGCTYSNEDLVVLGNILLNRKQDSRLRGNAADGCHHGGIAVGKIVGTVTLN